MGEPDEPSGRAPDYRFTLANERTFLAWIRTSLALLAGGIAVRELGSPLGVEGARTGLATTGILSSVLLAVWSLLRWSRIERAMRRGEPLPSAVGVPVLAVGVAGAGVTAAVLLLVS